MKKYLIIILIFSIIFIFSTHTLHATGIPDDNQTLTEEKTELPKANVMNFLTIPTGLALIFLAIYIYKTQFDKGKSEKEVFEENIIKKFET